MKKLFLFVALMMCGVMRAMDLTPSQEMFLAVLQTYRVFNEEAGPECKLWPLSSPEGALPNPVEVTEGSITFGVVRDTRSGHYCNMPQHLVTPWGRLSLMIGCYYNYMKRGYLEEASRIFSRLTCRYIVGEEDVGRSTKPITCVVEAVDGRAVPCESHRSHSPSRELWEGISQDWYRLKAWHEEHRFAPKNSAGLVEGISGGLYGGYDSREAWKADTFGESSDCTVS